MTDLAYGPYFRAKAIRVVEFDLWMFEDSAAGGRESPRESCTLNATLSTREIWWDFETRDSEMVGVSGGVIAKSLAI